MSVLSNLSRREFLTRCTAASAAALASDLLYAQDIRAGAQMHLPLRDTALKFGPDGSTKPFAGNTVICHLPAQSAMRDRMALLHDALAAAPFRSALGLTSIASYHMTVFNGANDQDRKMAAWPPYVPIDAPISVCSQRVGGRMEKLLLHCELPIRMRIDEQATLTHPTATTLRLEPADGVEAAKLRSIRDQLGETYGYRLENHDSYQFHITMSYQVRDFTPTESMAYRGLLQVHLSKIIAAAPVVELGSPEYCTFADMQRFEPVLLLRSS